MSDEQRRLTGIHLIGSPWNGLANWGKRTPKEMIEWARSIAVVDKAIAEQILAASDEDFHVTTFIGVHVQKKREVLQKGRDRATPLTEESDCATTQK